jgi:hypothetical protein
LTRQKHHQLGSIWSEASEGVTVKKRRLFPIDCPDAQGSFTPWIFAPWMLSELLQVPVWIEGDIGMTIATWIANHD